ncbi:MAG: ribbon-helix-helix domain-containing protein [Gammaproteobacteria bacterium]|nr:ribbon-helix-helix domain-containing protein [Gammaproteobacteria bacterium]
MGKSIKHQQPLYLDHEKADLLAKLAEETRVPRQVLLREAVDDLLIKHGAMKPPRSVRAKPKAPK